MDRLTAQGKAFSAAQGAMYTDRCTVRRISKVKGPDMGNSNSETILASNVPCRISPSSANERMVAGAVEGVASFTVRLPFWQGDHPITVGSTCLLDIHAREETPAQTLAVIAPLPGSSTKIDMVAIRQS